MEGVMIDFTRLEQYKENNRIEAKLSLGGLPESIWETYSAFANTLGGLILLGVDEYPDKSLHPVDLPYPEELIEELWGKLNDGKTVSANILSIHDITIEKIEGKYIVAVHVPAASRKEKPVYIGADPFLGSYFRSGEGDYRFTEEEVRVADKPMEGCSLTLPIKIYTYQNG